MTPPPFAVITAGAVHAVLDGAEPEVTALVESAYRLHGLGRTVNPPSHFLRFPDRPSARIIALPASVGGDVDVHGLKWISSFPTNGAHGLPRASAVLILNDAETGYPFACLESATISSARTAASAALAADHLTRSRPRPTRVGFVGTGVIARQIHTYLAGTGWKFEEIGVFDTSPAAAAAFAEGAVVHDSAESLIRSSDLIVFATVAGTPHVHDPSWFAHNPVVLHVSLRDLSPEVVLSAVNVVDDVDHCLKADTSPHLAEQRVGNRDFVDGTLYDVLTDTLAIPADRPVIFSPFGLGVLDLVLAKHVHERASATGALHTVPDFFTP
ncbi:2,3-diaminopropionate biosynthesis protein SbnB [Actinosynnema sp. NPDC020468]|uniref:2,3-diaminopropionate biosynthesis protein SbnB n=1 Tax=Actinosynnema sp. NPDC020468 TaxID=3154488 RepID=UPI0033D4BB76